ncbi:MAG: hypothetical protein ABMB14_23015 [Myxococcota bacterium]
MSSLFVAFLRLLDHYGAEWGLAVPVPNAASTCEHCRGEAPTPTPPSGGSTVVEDPITISNGF